MNHEYPNGLDQDIRGKSDVDDDEIKRYKDAVEAVASFEPVASAIPQETQKHIATHAAKHESAPSMNQVNKQSARRATRAIISNYFGEK